MSPRTLLGVFLLAFGLAACAGPVRPDTPTDVPDRSVTPPDSSREQPLAPDAPPGILREPGGFAASDSLLAVAPVLRRTVLATFRDARALGMDPAGQLYVVDAAAAQVVVLDTAGVRRAAFGGPGTGDYGLLDPADVDPTNGLDLFVADAGNGRIQRFSRDGRFIETVPVPLDGDDEGGVPPAGRDPFGPDPGARGRPVAVGVGPGGLLVALDASRREVRRWEGAARRAGRALGGTASGPGALDDPVGLAVASDGTLYVADRGRNAVLVFEPYGRFVRSVTGVPAGGVRTVGLAGAGRAQRLLVVGPRAVAVHDPAAGLLRVIPVDLGEDLVDAAVAGGALYVLTPTRLLRVAE